MTPKDQSDIQGYDCTLGYVGRACMPAAQDSVLVSLLKQMGAVIIAKSNLPQSIMCETENPMWGLTIHPKNPDSTPGGSPSREGALLFLCSSVVGWGTDIGGSIRIPSHMLGLSGLKPSSTTTVLLSADGTDRPPVSHGVTVSTEGQEHVPSVVGPMAGSLGSIISATNAVIAATPWNLDPK
ncbi:amidase signature enzyme [Lindgomyces ingoldianus]|uniref:Amidase signature enzyme n=1 Tax=Lindgomyces ingoldianus TaxID=673940 RepID=A0ACB6QDK6_9PLEO|nr:amidase signature enzyme [Lindgomyces ingoldianus]KAF2465104.1 amidase signature enzyme [Lindgomyces ingoldianus]